MIKATKNAYKYKLNTKFNHRECQSLKFFYHRILYKTQLSALRQTPEFNNYTSIMIIINYTQCSFHWKIQQIKCLL